VQPDGKIVAGGVTQPSTPGGSTWTVVRYNTDGTPDPSFGTAGLVTTAMSGADPADLTQLALQSDGKIVTVGYVWHPSSLTADGIIARYNPDGSLDPSFGTGGIARLNTGRITAWYGVALQNGNIVVAGNGEDAPVMARYTTNGVLDPTFGNFGTVRETTGTFSLGDVAVQTDNKLVSAGWRGNTTYVYRFNPDGSLDTGFATGGLCQLSVGSTSTILNHPKLQSDGKILLAGSVSNGSDTESSATLARLDPTGALDSTFGQNGIAVLDKGPGQDGFSSLEFDSLGRLLAGGFATSAGTPAWLIARYTNNTAPSLGAITVSPNPVLTGATVTASVSLTDPDPADTHTATWDWGDGSTTSGAVAESNGSGSISGTHSYVTPGVYQITLAVTDNHGASANTVYQYLSVYNPTPQGLFTGARHFTSPAGAVPGQPTLSGPAQFGLTARYQGSVPTGNLRLTFAAANLDFASTDLSLLVVSGNKATLRGSGTINGVGAYTFLATGLDGGTTSDDFVRFQIKDIAGTIIYDSQPGAPDTADPTTKVGAGQVVIH
jgi:uncharacterized delta-60 repeat protein